MRHLKTINELLKSTYLSASDKLKELHGKRSKALIDHATKKGKNVKQERIYPHRFLFDDTLEGEYFFITEWFVKESPMPRSLAFKVEMKSNWGNIKDISLYFKIYDPLNYRIDHTYLKLESTGTFRNVDSKIGRQNAHHLLKFFKECWEDEISDDYDKCEVKGLSINSLYTSEKS